MKFPAAFKHLLVMALLLSPTAAADNPAAPFDMARVRDDLARIDAKITEGASDNQSPLVGKPIKARDIYLGYIEKAAEISQDLLKAKTQIELHDRSVSLQRLGALAHQVSVKNQRFRESFRHGEDEFQTYTLIQTAVTNLNDAIEYWRLANRYRAPYRGSALEKNQDDEILQVKLQTAINAIDELKRILDARDALKQALDD